MSGPRTNFESSPASLYDSLPDLVIDAFPADAPNIVITSDASVWGYGSFVEVIPVNTITTDFWIYGLHIGISNPAGSSNVFDVAKGDVGSEIVIMQTRKAVSGRLLSHTQYPIPIKVDANTRISVRVADSGAAAVDSDVAILYITGL